MFHYMAILMIPAMLAQFQGRRISMITWIFVFLVYLIFVGFRHEVGPDWPQYWHIHESMEETSFGEVAFRSEPLSYLLFWVSQNGGMNVYFTNVVGAFILLFGVFAFAARTANPWLAIVAASPYFIFVTGMSGVRQSIAAGVMLFLLARWNQFSVVRRFSYIIIAAMFHTSALVNSIFLVTQLNIPFRYKIVFGAMILGLTFIVGSEVGIFADSMQKYQERYIDNPQGVESLGALFHIALILLPAFLGFIYRRRIIPYIHNGRLFQFGLYAAVLVFAVNFISSTAASRLTLYLYFLPMMIFSSLSMAAGPAGKKTMTSLIILGHLGILGIWFTLGNHKIGYINYKNLLFTGF